MPNPDSLGPGVRIEGQPIVGNRGQPHRRCEADSFPSQPDLDRHLRAFPGSVAGAELIEAFFPGDRDIAQLGDLVTKFEPGRRPGAVSGAHTQGGRNDGDSVGE